MMRVAATIAVVAAALAGASSAKAATALVAADPAVGDVTALDGTVVWVSGAISSQTLMLRQAGAVVPLPGAAAAYRYADIDLGHDRDGSLVLTYLRCPDFDAAACAVVKDDLRGHAVSIKRGLAPKRCAVTSAPTLWRARMAYGVSCHRRGSSATDRKRTGLYVKRGADAPRQVALPAAARRNGAVAVEAVDLFGTRVAAIAGGGFIYALAGSVSGKRWDSFEVAEQDEASLQDVPDVALGAAGELWTLLTNVTPGTPNSVALMRRLGGCLAIQRFAAAPGAPPSETVFPATDLAIDGATLYLATPAGIVTNDFVPETACP